MLSHIFTLAEDGSGFVSKANLVRRTADVTLNPAGSLVMAGCAVATGKRFQ
jgi:hypothetical protein